RAERMRKIRIWVSSVAAVVLALDQLSKWWIRVVVMDPPRTIEMTPFFNLVYARNTGVSFSMFRADSLIGQWMLAGVALAIVAGLLVWMRRLARPWPGAALGLIVGGAIGNVVDRLRLRFVFDFLDFYWNGYHFAAFNLADTAITVGVAMLLIDGLFGRAENAKKARN
ncbi:MAG: signal peptidase II, partial [Dongiaceae bacterium]